MTLEELIKEVPALAPYFEHMPEELHNRYTIRVYPPGTIIHQKDYKLEKASVNFVVYWEKQEDKKEAKIVLPKVVFKKV